MSIDWSATGAMLQGWGTLIGAVAVFWAAKKGADTFDSWKRQKVAERKLEQAERILMATYKARRALSFVRGIMMDGRELDAAEEKLKVDFGLVTVLCRSLNSLCHLGFECERADAAQI